MNSCQVIFQGMFVLENLWTLWTIIPSGYDVLGIDMTFDIRSILGMISTLKALIPRSTTEICHHSFNLSWKMHGTLKLFFMHSCQMIVKGNFVLEKLWTLWAIITSWYDVLGINVALDIVRISRLISALGAFIQSITQNRHQWFNAVCKTDKFYISSKVHAHRSFLCFWLRWWL